MGVTNLEAFHRHRIGDTVSIMEGKYPNGLKAAMAQLKMGPTALAKVAKTSKQNVDRFRKGTRELTARWAEKLAPHVNKTAEELVFPGSKNLSQRVPIISWVSAGRLADTDPVFNVDSKRHIAVSALPRGNWIALEVEGDSMNKIAPDGSIILVNRTDDKLLPDKFYVVSNAQGETTFKRYKQGNSGPGRLQPFSTNSDHETIPVVPEMQVVGRVRRVIIDLN